MWVVLLINTLVAAFLAFFSKSSQDKRHCCYSSSRSSLFDLSYSKLEYDKRDRA